MKLLFLLFCAACVFAQSPVYSLAPVPKQQFLDSSGRPLSGGLILTCPAGATCSAPAVGAPPSNPITTYSDNSGTPNTNPIVLDSGGFANIWLSSLYSYKFVVQNSQGVQQAAVDNIAGGNPSLNTLLGANGASALNYQPAGGASRTVASKLGDIVNAADYGVKCDGTTDDTVNLQAAVNNSAASSVIMLPSTGNACMVTGGIQIAARNGLTITSAAKTTLRVPAGTPDTVYNSWPNFGLNSIFRIYQSSNITLSNLTLDGNLSNRTANSGSESFNSDVLVMGSNDIIIDGCSLLGAMTDAVTLDYSYWSTPAPGVISQRIWVTNNYVQNARRNGISVVAGNGVHILGNVVNGTGTVQGTAPKAGIDIEPSFNSTDINDIDVAGNSFTGSAAAGVFLNASNLQVSNVKVRGNYASSNASEGIDFDNNAGSATCSVCSITDNLVTGNTFSGIRDRGMASVISDNNVVNNTVGLALLQTSGAIISGNQISGNINDGIELGSAGFAVPFSSATIVANNIHDNASTSGLAGGGGFCINAWSNSSATILIAASNTCYSSAGASSLQRGIQLLNAGTGNAVGNTFQNTNTDRAQISSLLNQNEMNGANFQDPSVTSVNVTAGTGQSFTPVESLKTNSGTVAFAWNVGGGFTNFSHYNINTAALVGQITHAASNAAGSQWWGVNNLSADYLYLNSVTGPVQIGTGSSGRFSITVDNAAGNVAIKSGTNVVLRCATAGTLPIGALTITASSCGTTTDTGLRVP